MIEMIRKSKVLRAVVAPSILVLMFSGILFTSAKIRLEKITADTTLLADLTPINKNMIKPFLLGHEAFYADLLWIQSIQKSAEQGVPNLFEYLEGTLSVITDLDMRFDQVFIWAGLTLNYANSTKYTYKQKVEKANAILLKGWEFSQKDTQGWKRVSNYWMIPELIAYNYGIELKDSEKALEYARALLAIPEVPTIMKTWAATMSAEQNKLNQGKDFMENLLAIETLQARMDLTDDEAARDKLKGKLMLFYKKLNESEYAAKRIAQIQEQIKNIFDKWRTDYQFLPFSFYVLLHAQETSPDYKNANGIYDVFFPNLGGLQ